MTTVIPASQEVTSSSFTFVTYLNEAEDLNLRPGLDGCTKAGNDSSYTPREELRAVIQLHSLPSGGGA
jgi:hypothetical protein